MNLVQFIQSFEALIYEIALWLVLIPKTLRRILLTRTFPRAYVYAELEKPADERFDTHISPVFLWLAAAVIPYLVIIIIISKRIGGKYGTIFLGSFPAFQIETKLMLVVLFLITGPLGFAAGLCLAKKIGISRNNLKPHFYIQSYIFTPAYIFLLPFEYLFLSNLPDITKFDLKVGLTSLFITAGWLIYSEVPLIREETGYSWIKSFGLLVLISFITYMLFLVMYGLIVFGNIFINDVPI
jgi:hypothetical protein